MSDAKDALPGIAQLAPRGAAGTTFVGRAGERTELRAALDEVLGGRGRLILLAGEPGIGKTRLADELATEAAAQGARVAWGRCWEGEGAPAYWPWTQILRSLIQGDDAAAGVVRSVPLLAALLPEFQASGDPGAGTPEPMAITALGSAEPQGERFRLFDAVLVFLQTIARTKPLLIVFDDCHVADTTSLLLLRFIARDLRRLPVMLVVTYRDTEVQVNTHFGELMADLGREGATLRLLGLSETDARRLIEVSAGRAPDDASVEALYRATEGNPFFLTEIVRLLISQKQLFRVGGGLGAFRIPDSVRVAIRRRVRLASEMTQGALNVAAIVGREFDVAVIRAAVKLPLKQLTRAMDEAEACGIVTRLSGVAGRYRFSHALIPETLCHDLPQARCRQIHLRIARTIEGMHRANLAPHLAELAYHYARALPAGPWEKAFEYARRGAQHAQALLAYQEAARLCEMALAALELQQPVDEKQRCEILLRLGEAQYGAGLFNHTREAFQRAAASARSLGSAEHLAHAALGFGMPPLSPYHLDETLLRLLEEALAALPDRDGPLRAMVLSRLAAELYWSADRQRGAALSRRAVEMARRLGDHATLIYVLYTHHLAAWSVDNLDERLRIATEIVGLAEDPSSRRWATSVWGLRAHYLHFADLLETGDMRAVDEAIERYASLAAKLQQHLGYEELARATRALMDGRFDEAERMADQAMAVAQRLERRARPFRQAINSLMLILRREQGRVAELMPIFGPVGTRATHAPLARCALALCLAELGRRDEAAAELERLAGDDFASLPRDGGWMATMVLLTEVCVFLRDRDRAAALYRLLVPYAARNATLDVHVCYGSVAHYLGMLAETMGDHDRAAADYEAALQFNLEMGASVWVAHTRYHYAVTLLARNHPGDRDKAAALAAAALITAESLGMRSLAAKLRALEGLDLSAIAGPGGTVTILFTDIQDSTGMTERLGDRRAQEVIRLHNAIVRQQVAANQGFEVKSMGDGFMIAFASARSAVLCAIAIQRAFATYNAQHGDASIRVAIGLHTGEAIREAGDFYGKTVILAARIGAQARGGETLVSATVRELTDGAGDLRFDAGREVALKGFAGTHRLYALLWDESPQ